MIYSTFFNVRFLKWYQHHHFLQCWLILVQGPQCAWTILALWCCGMAQQTHGSHYSLALMLELTHLLQGEGSSPDGLLICNLACPETIAESPLQGQIGCLKEYLAIGDERGKIPQEFIHSFMATCWIYTYMEMLVQETINVTTNLGPHNLLNRNSPRLKLYLQF